MKTIDLLRQTAPDLARQIEAAGASELRMVAMVVAQAAVSRTGLSDPVFDEVMQRLKARPAMDAELQARVQTLAEKLDEEYFVLKEPLEDREDAGKTDPQVSLAFSKARAASAVAAALGDDRLEAAASAAYEAYFATDDSEYLSSAMQKAMQI